MTLQEAAGSGRPFKRLFHTDWLTFDARGRLSWVGPQGNTTITRESILANDWMVQPVYSQEEERNKVIHLSTKRKSILNFFSR